MTAHCFRHSRATYWCENHGDNPLGVMYMLGHTKVSTTERYAKTSKRAGDALVDATDSPAPTRNGIAVVK